MARVVHNFIPFDVTYFRPFDVVDGKDLRINLLQEDGSDAAYGSWFEARGLRIKDDIWVEG